MTESNLKKLLRRPTRSTFSAFASEFIACELPAGWYGVACSAGHLGVPESDLEQTLRAIYDSSSKTEAATLLKSSPSGRVAKLEVKLAGGNALPVICKQGVVSSLVQRLGTWFKGPKEWREFWLGHRLRQLGLPTPLPVACMWRSAGFCHIEGRIVTEIVDEALPIDRAIRKLDAARDGHHRSPLLGTLTHRMVEILRTLGDNKLYHRDLKVSNVLVSNCEKDPQPRLIDLDGVGQERVPHGPRFHNMLARLVSSLSESTDLGTTQHLRALKQLAGSGSPEKGEWKATWMEIQSAAAQLDIKKRRLGSDVET